jgi:hypothetical protein
MWYYGCIIIGVFVGLFLAGLMGMAAQGDKGKDVENEPHL